MTVRDVLALTPAPPSRPALVSTDRTWTYEELATATDARADDLRSEGVEAGTLVPLVLEADVEWIVTLFALWRIGATPAPLNARLTAPEVARAREVLAGAVDRAGPAQASHRGAQAVLWTSGSAGNPRGVVIPFDAIAASTRAAAQRLDLRGDDVWLASLSPAHVGGLVLVARAALLGSTLVVSGPFDAQAVSEWIDGKSRTTVTHASFVPTQLLRLLDFRRATRAPDTFRCALIGGAKAPERLVARAVAEGWPVALTYGLTEATSQVATAPAALVRRKPGTVGSPLEGVEIRLAEDGEVLVRGATLASGYLTESLEPLADAEGWHHTGDLGRLDGDAHLWLIGRRIDRIVSGGVTVDAVEVEEALRAHPAVRDAGVVGVPDEEWGERVGAWVEVLRDDAPGPPAAGALGAGRPDALALEAWLRERLAPAKRPRIWLLEPSLPRSANGKLDRAAVREALRARGTAAGRND